MINYKQSPRGKSKKSEILKKYNISNKMVAKWFDYASDNSFNGSHCKDEVLKGVELVIKYIESMK
jgi:hypothetical protein